MIIIVIVTRAHRRGGEHAVRRSSQDSDGDGSLTEVVDDVIFCPKLFEEIVDQAYQIW